MTSWYAVGVGLVVLVVANLVGILVPGLGQLAGTVLGGATAGYVAGGGVRRSFWHGFLTGVIPGIAIAGVFVLGVALLDFAFRPIGMLGDAAGLPPMGSIFAVGAAGAFLAFIIAAFAFVSGVGGIVGGVLKDL